MKRALDRTTGDQTPASAKKKRKGLPVDDARETLASIRLQTGFDISNGFDFDSLEQEEMQLDRNTESQAPRLISMNLVNSDINRLPYDIHSIDKYLNLARAMANISEKLEEIPDIIAIESECEMDLPAVQILALECESDDDLLKLEDEIRFVTSSQEAQLRMAQDDLEELEMELEMQMEPAGSLNENGEEDDENNCKRW